MGASFLADRDDGGDYTLNELWNQFATLPSCFVYAKWWALVGLTKIDEKIVNFDSQFAYNSGTEFNNVALITTNPAEIQRDQKEFKAARF